MSTSEPSPEMMTGNERKKEAIQTQERTMSDRLAGIKPD
jgi:hypothetical protein